jgi:hypothetical protein
MTFKSLTGFKCTTDTGKREKVILKGTLAAVLNKN